jgi:hypothetical protein
MAEIVVLMICFLEELIDRISWRERGRGSLSDVKRICFSI